jgi:RNA polymerase sigma-70 factor (ECF subfamily)
MKERPAMSDEEPRDQRAMRLGAEALFRAHAPFVAAFVTRLGAAPGEVEDIVQEVFLVAHAKGGYEPGPALPRSWLAAIALRITKNHQRSRLRRREDASDALDAQAGSARTPHESAEITQSLARVQRALETLDLEHRATFILFEIEGEPGQAIAASFELPIGTVYSRLHHARRRFAEAYRASEEPATAALPGSMSPRRSS